MQVDAVVCCDNHVDTIFEVAAIAAYAPQISQTIIVDAGSEDGTAERAEDVRGAHVLRASAGYRKGDYELIGISASRADAIVFLAPDLIGLDHAHIETLTWPVTDGDCGMSCGLFDRGPIVNQVYERMLPIVDTQRAVHRSVIEAASPADIAAFSLEPALNAVCADLRVPTHSVVLPGLRYHVDAERGRPPLGLVREHISLTRAIWSYASYRVSHKRLEAPEPVVANAAHAAA